MRSQSIRTKLTLITLSSLFLLSYQNCGDVGLVKPVDLGGDIDVESVNPTYLRPPEPKRTTLRAAFLVDMSVSMQAGACQDSVDTWVSPDIIPQNCTEPTGVDTVLNRLEMIRSWIQQARSYLAAIGVTDPEALKVLIIPFSKGNSISSYLPGEPLMVGYQDSAAVDLFVDKLKVIQRCFQGETCAKPPHLATWNWSTSRSQAVVATSVPGPSMSEIKTITEGEINRLRSLGRLSSTQFEFTFLSDGVAKPTIDHIERVAYEIWQQDNNAGCISSCTGQLRNYLMSGNIFDASESCRTCIMRARDFRLQGSFYAGGNFNYMKALWGDFQENRMEMIFLRINNIRYLFLENPQASYRFNFVRVDASNQAYQTANSEKTPAKNWIEKAKEIYNSGNHRFATINSNHMPFHLFSNVGSGQSYRLESLLISNLNVRARLPNQLEVDSDGDGLSDRLEVELGFNPLKSRTNGICLDSIVVKTGGCITELCSPNIDEDKDGLNQCEEKTLGTSDYDIDTDGDGIPDPLELLYDSNPMVSDRFQDSNSDGVSNYIQFQLGLHPLADYEMFEAKDLIRHRLNFIGFRTEENQAGQQVQVAGYRIGFKVPYRNSREVREPVVNGFSFLGVNQPANTNTILVYAKVQNVQNSADFYWIGKRYQITTDGTEQMPVDLSTMQILNVLDPSLEGR